MILTPEESFKPIAQQVEKIIKSCSRSIFYTKDYRNYKVHLASRYSISSDPNNDSGLLGCKHTLIMITKVIYDT